MIEVKAKLLVFDKVDKCGRVFPNDCKIDIPEKVPVVLANGPFTASDIIGVTLKIDRNDFDCETLLNINNLNEELLEHFKEHVTDELLYAGGHFTQVETHIDDAGHTVIDGGKLVGVGIFFGDIYGDKDLDTSGIDTLKTDAPVVFDKLQHQKHTLWNECMTFLGINNANMDKRERLVDDEVQANNEQIELSAAVMLKSRELAAERINALFGTNISVELRKPTTADFEGIEGVLNE
jgi:hypothetical protein